jgi:hypothetical protein
VATRLPDLLAFLEAQRLVESLRVLVYDETPWGKTELKVRCRLSKRSGMGDRYELQVWLHHEPALQDYAYQLFADRPLLRWDNAPHYPHVTSAPHHFHNEINQVFESPLSGDPLTDLPKVLDEIERWIATQ